MIVRDSLLSKLPILPLVTTSLLASAKIALCINLSSALIKAVMTSFYLQL